jgi:hypothetical protein
MRRILNDVIWALRFLAYLAWVGALFLLVQFKPTRRIVNGFYLKRQPK